MRRGGSSGLEIFNDGNAFPFESRLGEQRRMHCLAEPHGRAAEAVREPEMLSVIELREPLPE